MNWGKAITLAFVLFAGFIFTFVYKMMHQNIDLVREDYYKEELNFEKQIERVRNSNKTNTTMKYSPENQQITIALPQSVRNGEVLFFRPSDKSLDFKKKLSTDSLFNFKTNEMAKGRWKIQCYWSDGHNDYFKEEELFIE